MDGGNEMFSGKICRRVTKKWIELNKIMKNLRGGKE